MSFINSHPAHSCHLPAARGDCQSTRRNCCVPVSQRTTARVGQPSPRPSQRHRTAPCRSPPSVGPTPPSSHAESPSAVKPGRSSFPGRHPRLSPSLGAYRRWQRATINSKDSAPSSRCQHPAPSSAAAVSTHSRSKSQSQLLDRHSPLPASTLPRKTLPDPPLCAPQRRHGGAPPVGTGRDGASGATKRIRTRASLLAQT